MSRPSPIWQPTVLALALASALAACSQQAPETAAPAAAPVAAGPTVADAEKFVAEAEAELERLVIEASRADWIANTHITEDTEALTAKASEKVTAKGVELANAAAKFNGLQGLSAETARKLEKLRLALVLPAPNDAKATEELAQLTSGLNATYGKGKYCKTNDKGEENCRSLGQLEDVLANAPDEKGKRAYSAADLLDAWNGWHEISKPMRADYVRLVEIANAGAKELGYDNVGAMWRSKYDMAPDEFAAELDRLWGQVKPLYDALHCHVRSKLSEKYGADVVPQQGPIPAHLLGNMWAQQWANVYDFVKPEGKDAYNLDDIVVKKYGKPTANLDGVKDIRQTPEGKMVLAGEAFFSSLGFAPLPDSFWTRSQFLKPRDRDVVCHASAWDLDNKDDLRIKMCIKMNAEDFVTIHHELGHNYYQRAYKDKPFLFMDSANDGFHEAIGDTVALGLTPKYLVQIGLLDKEPDASGDLPMLMRTALDKVAFMPFGLLVDQWRWKVFSGEITPENYNSGWWQLREKYQGVKAPNARSEDHFDPGAKYHVPGNVPYSRYFLAHILQFQFYREMCKQSGHEGPLHRCTFFGNKEVGAKLNKMLEMGASQPWQDALEAMTGSREMDASAVVDYFAPLKAWLDEQNKSRQCGW